MSAIIIRHGITRHANIAYVATFIPEVYRLLGEVGLTTELSMQERVEDYAHRMRRLLGDYPETIHPVFFYEILGIPLNSELLHVADVSELSLSYELMCAAKHWSSIVQGRVNNIRWLVRGVPLHTCVGVTKTYIARRYNLKISGQIPV